MTETEIIALAIAAVIVVLQILALLRGSGKQQLARLEQLHAELQQQQQTSERTGRELRADVQSDFHERLLQPVFFARSH